MAERVTITLGGERLPAEVRSLLSARPVAAHRYRVTVEEIEETEEEKREALRSLLAERIADMRAGKGLNGEEVMNRLERKYSSD